MKTYKRLITYTISNDEARNSLKSLLKMEELDFEEQSDQSTLAQEVDTAVSIKELLDELKEWSENVQNKFMKGDFIDIYEPSFYNGISLYKIFYSSRLNKLIFPNIEQSRLDEYLKCRFS